MDKKFANLSGEALNLIKAAERQIGELGSKVILLAFEPEK